VDLAAEHPACSQCDHDLIRTKAIAAIHASSLQQTLPVDHHGDQGRRRVRSNAVDQKPLAIGCHVVDRSVWIREVGNARREQGQRSAVLERRACRDGHRHQPTIRADKEQLAPVAAPSRRRSTTASGRWRSETFARRSRTVRIRSTSTPPSVRRARSVRGCRRPECEQRRRVSGRRQRQHTDVVPGMSAMQIFRNRLRIDALHRTLQRPQLVS